MAPPCPVETGEGGQGANGDDARQRRASDASSGGVSTTPPQRRLSDLHDGASPPSVMRPPSNPREPFVVDAADFSAGKCTPFVNLGTEAGRLATFRTRWRVTSDGGLVSFPERRLKPLTPAMLAKAGFLYCPDAAHADRCVCFCCNRALHTWDPADNPLYEHCRVNAECPYVQAAVSDDVDELRSRGLKRAPSERGGTGGKGAAAAGAGAGAGDARESPRAWRLDDGCTWPRDTVIDHLLICVHGVNFKGPEKLQGYVDAMRKNSEYVAGKHLDDRPMMVAVDAIDWHTKVEGVPK
ncbi:MAG: baculoviral IAP repeat-containing protein, partial [Promethearchaeia archaeon]